MYIMYIMYMKITKNIKTTSRFQDCTLNHSMHLQVHLLGQSCWCWILPVRAQQNSHGFVGLMAWAILPRPRFICARV